MSACVWWRVRARAQDAGAWPQQYSLDGPAPFQPPLPTERYPGTAEPAAPYFTLTHAPPPGGTPAASPYKRAPYGAHPPQHRCAARPPLA